MITSEEINISGYRVQSKSKTDAISSMQLPGFSENGYLTSDAGRGGQELQFIWRKIQKVPSTNIY